MHSHHCGVKLSIILCLSIFFVQVESGSFFECDTASECLAPDITCEDNFCTCPSCNVLTNDGSQCLELAMQINSKCESSEQCALIGGPALCVDGKCKCDDNYVYLKKACIKRKYNGAFCANNDDCFDGLNYNSRICSDNKCECATGYYSRNDFDCRPRSGLGDACAINTDCNGSECVDGICQNSPNATQIYDQVQSEHIADDVEEDVPCPRLVLEESCSTNDECTVKHSLCNSLLGKCLCKKGYFKKGKKCVPELGMSCKLDDKNKSECPIGSKCIQNTCGCEGMKLFDSTNQKCRLTAVAPTFECNSDDSCRFMYNNYHCDDSGVQKVCKCKSGFRLNDLDICVDNKECTIDKDCESKMPNSYCTIDQTCVCKEEYVEIGRICKPRIGGVCTVTKDCKEMVDHSICSEGKCICEDKFVPHEYGCLKESAIGDQCEIDAQCQWKSKAQCQENSAKKETCACEDGYLNVNGNCLRIATRVGDYCTTPAVCMSDAICLKSKCICKDSFKTSPDQASCYSPKETNSAPATTIASVVLVSLSCAFLALQ